MEAELQKKCDQLIENYNTIRPGNSLEYDSLLVAGAAMFVANDQTADAERLLSCKNLLKKEKGVFSAFRGITEFIVRCKMAMAEDPEAYLTQLDSAYKGIKTFFSGEQTLLAAMVIVDLAAPDKQEQAVQQTKALYMAMHKAHPFLTSEDDMPFAALMAVTGRDGESTYGEAEKNYGILKEQLRASAECRQMLSHILALYQGPAEIKCDRIRSIDDGLREAKHALSRDRYLAILGTLAGTATRTEKLVAMIGEADDYLSQFKPFKGLLGVGKEVRRMVAVQMVESLLEDKGLSGISGSTTVSSVISTSIEVTIITLILMYAVIASSSAARSH